MPGLSKENNHIHFPVNEMNAPSLFMLPDRNMFPLHVENMSDQAIMELFVEKYPKSFQRRFKNKDGEFKDVCKWKGITCNGRRQVTHLSLGERGLPQISASATNIDLHPLPQHLKEFHVLSLYGKTKNIGRLDVSALPENLESFQVMYQTLIGSVDFRRLPTHLWGLYVCDCGLSGSVDLTALPKTMNEFTIKENPYTGRLFLHCLPQSLVLFNAEACSFIGDISLSHLPEKLESLSISRNKLSGSVHLEKLPRAMLELFLSGNNFSGEIQVLQLPPELEILALEDNNFSGTAIIESRMFHIVDLQRNSLEGAVDEKGQPCEIPTGS